MELFITESEIRDPMLASGFFKLLIRKPPMPDPSKAFALDLPSIDEGGVPYMRMRVAFGNKADDEALLEVDPQQNAGKSNYTKCDVREHRLILTLWIDRYKLPSSIKNVKPTSLDSTDRRGSAQCPEAAVDNPMRQSNDQGAHSIDRSNNQRRPSVVNIQPTKDRLPGTYAQYALLRSNRCQTQSHHIRFQWYSRINKHFKGSGADCRGTMDQSGQALRN